MDKFWEAAMAMASLSFTFGGFFIQMAPNLEIF
jgi:hypothetical protein